MEQEDIVVLQNRVIAEWCGSQLHAKLLQLVANFSGPLRAAFADDDTSSFGGKVTAEGKPDLATSLHSDNLTLDAFAKPFGGGLKGHQKQTRTSC
jgi:hypothetical protein